MKLYIHQFRQSCCPKAAARVAPVRVQARQPQTSALSERVANLGKSKLIKVKQSKNYFPKRIRFFGSSSPRRLLSRGEGARRAGEGEGAWQTKVYPIVKTSCTATFLSVFHCCRSSACAHLWLINYAGKIKI